jgi:hypothetical protein
MTVKQYLQNVRENSFLGSSYSTQRCVWCNRHDAKEGEYCNVSKTTRHEIRSDKDCPYCGTKGPHENNEASEQELIYLCKNEKCGEHFGPGTEV